MDCLNGSTEGIPLAENRMRESKSCLFYIFTALFPGATRKLQQVARFQDASQVGNWLVID